VSAATAKPITFIVPGHDAPPAVGRERGAAAPPSADSKYGRLKQSVQVSTQREGAAGVRVDALPGEDVVVLQIAGGPELVLHPENARDLMRAQQTTTRSRGAGDEVQVAGRLRWRGLEEGGQSRGATRGVLGDAILSAVHVVTGQFTGPAAAWTASEIVKRFDAHVDPGVYQLTPDALPKLKGSGARVDRMSSAGDDPTLVFIHGTFSETQGTFGKLWTNHPQRVRALFTFYGGRVYGLDHPTLGASPIANAVTLAEALPKGARLHLVTHSRGGLVAEVLAHVCANAGGDRTLFAGKAYAGQRAELDALTALVAAKKIQVERVVRVACPARGTLLASNRLDAFVSVFKWTLQLAGIPVATELLEFLGAVAQRRTDPLEIPGLAAQIPDSPLVRWLHSIDRRLDGQLRVVAGDLEGDSVTSWLKTLLADAFYWTDNDLVVQTRSMYGGGPRAADASFLLDAGGAVSHFNYFTNERTAEAVVSALVQAQPRGFRAIGPLSWAGTSATGVRGATPSAQQQREKPAVFLLPGILGSNLKVGKDRIWVGWRLINGLAHLAYPDAQGVQADGPIGSVYDDLIAYLSATHEVIPFGFDWRLPLEQEAKRLAAAVTDALNARVKSGTPGMPVRMIAHSMGGLLARTMQLVDAGVWKRMMAHPEARLLMLGTPNGGSWAPMQVLSGDDTFGNTLVAAGAPFHGYDARMEMARFPGFIQLQDGLLDKDLHLDKAETWQQLADDDLKSVAEHSWWHKLEIQRKAVEWGVPPQNVLTSAVALRTRLNQQRDHDLAEFADKMLLVTGHAKFTPAGYEKTADGLVYLNAPDAGDGRVTRESALLPGVRTWTLDCEHGSLPSKKEAFAAYSELLEKGNTALLDLLPASASRGAAAATVRVRARPSRSAVSTRPVQDEQEVLSVSRRESSTGGPVSPGTALRITVVNGDLTFIHHPLLLGHYRSSRLTGTERVMDERVGEMGRSLKAGLYPDGPGSHEIFVNTSSNPDNPLQMPRPQAVIVVGLGPEGNLQTADLVTTVRQGVIAWAHRLAEKADDLPPFFELATTLIASGGSGITARQSAQLIAQGVREANERLDDKGPLEIDGDPAAGTGDSGAKAGGKRSRKWPQVGHLHIIELYLERASEALSALQMQAIAAPGRYVVTETVASGIGALRRPVDAGYRGADYDFVTAVAENDGCGNSVIEYTLDTKRARSEVRAQKTQRRLLLNLVTGASSALNADPQIGRTLFQLLVPVEMEAYLSGTTDLQIALDGGTAGIPWELLDTDTQGRRESRPWAIRVKLLRKLLLRDFRARVVDADAESSVLVIGEPKCDPDKYPRLFGARAEARAVADRLMAADGVGGDRVRVLISPEDPDKFGPDAREVSNALMERDWRIVHISGHGDPPEMIGKEPENENDPPQKLGNPRGVVLSDGSYLGPREIENVRRVPELVFVNCCHLAWRPSDELLKKDHVRFAAGVAEALIGIGVRCVIAAGWAVDDGAARIFATTFYGALLRGCRFIDAVAEAREAAWALGGNTWAAYQCYGDPDWIFGRDGSDAQRPTPPADEFSGVTSPTALIIALETVAVQSEFQKADPQKQRDKIRYLADHFAPRWGHIGKVAESFGKACAEAKDQAGAIAWYARAIEANDATAGMKAAEQLGNLRARLAWQAVEQAERALTVAKAARKPAARRAFDTVLAQQRPTIESAIKDLEQLASVRPSMERASLCGSAYKRLAMLEGAARRPREEARATAKMLEHYTRAEALGRKNRLDFFYPAMNRMAAELAQYAGTPRWKGFKRAQFDDIRKVLETKARDDPEFWSVGGVTELRVYEALEKRDLAGQLEDVMAEFTELYERVSAPSKWQSIYDTARFVLPKYARRASASEKAAAHGLLKTLGRWAGAAP
jgi:tetratricopeptide (TPR) repeat protein